MPVDERSEFRVHPEPGRRLRRRAARLALLAGAVVLPALLANTPGLAGAAAPALQATTAPTVTGTPVGPYVLVPDEVNVRLGPGTDYDLVGVLISGQQAPALGRSPGGDWIQIEYVGVPGNVAWVYAPLVRLEGGQGFLSIVEPPPTPTLRVTVTIDPTLAAQFNLGDATPTRLPTFTVAPPVVQPTFVAGPGEDGGGFPPILAILGLLVIGLFGIVISFLRGS